ncbi:hypothetical protein [Paracidovorax wautersii]|uniref:hypothetical protein n=1 Tax=Paracidovorax wautersii TaxID=1177982 RepID=UPI00111420D2|nr:hypothetical protein [Paracidovorax wautersii]
MDDIAARHQRELGFARKLQASAVRPAGFAIRCGAGAGYGHKCWVLLPSINHLLLNVPLPCGAPYSVPASQLFHAIVSRAACACRAVRRAGACGVRAAMRSSVCRDGSAGVHASKVCLATVIQRRMGALPHGGGARRMACRRGPRKPQLRVPQGLISQCRPRTRVLQFLRNESVAEAV